jgi:hypothetical protein
MESSFDWFLEIRAIEKPSRPNLRATAAPSPGPAPMMAMTGTVVSSE